MILTTNDMKRFIEGAHTNMPIVRNEMFDLFETKEIRKNFEAKLTEAEIEILSSLHAPNIIKRVLEPTIGLFDLNDKGTITFDPATFSIFLLYNFYIGTHQEEAESRVRYLAIPELYYGGKTEEFKEAVKQECKKLRRIIHSSLSEEMPKEAKDICTQNREIFIWLTDNLDSIIEAFHVEIPQEALAMFHKEKLLLYLSYRCIVQTGFLEDEKQEVDLAPLEFVNNYLAYVDYQKELSSKYHVSYKARIKDMKVDITENTIKEQMGYIYEACEPAKPGEIGYASFEEVKENVLLDYHNQQKVEAFKRKIQCGWDFIPETPSMSSDKVRPLGEGRSKSKEEKDELESKKEALLQEKMELFEGLPAIAVLEGKNHLEGYCAFLFANGKVIFEKFYKKSINRRTKEETLLPVIDEAIYVMNYQFFAEMSTKSKPEIREFIQSAVDSDARVINHTKTFKSRVLSEVTTSGYNEEVLKYIDQLVEKSKDENEKTYGKTN